MMDVREAEAALLLGDTQPLVDSLAAMMEQGNLRAIAQLRRAEVRMVRREMEPAIEDVLESGRALAEDPERGVVAELLAARLLNRTMRVDAANTLFAHAAPRVPPDSSRGFVMREMTRGEMALDTQRWADARAIFEPLIVRLDEPRFAHEAAQAWLCLATIAQVEGRLPDAALSLLEVIKIAAQHGDAVLGAEPRFTLGVLHLRIQDHSTGKDLLGAAAEDTNLSLRHRALAHNLLGRIALKELRWPDGVALGLRGARMSAQLNEPYGYLEGSVIVSTAQARAGDVAEAGRTCDAAEAVLRERGHNELAELMARHRQDLSGAAAPQ